MYELLQKKNKMNVNRGVARAAPRVPVIPPLYVPTIQEAKTCESGESKCNQPFPVLDCCLPICGTEHLQWTMFLFLVRKYNRVYIATWNGINPCSYLTAHPKQCHL